MKAQRPCDIPPSQKSIVDCSGCDTNYARPLCERLGYAHVGDMPISGGIVGLCCFYSPSAIIRRIVPVVISSVNRMFVGWSHPHISDEIGKPIVARPALANSDASTTVQMKIRGVLIITSVFYISKSAGFWRSVKPMFTFYTPARICFSTSKIVPVRRSCVATITYPAPTHLIADASGCYGEFPDFLTCKVDEFWHYNILRDIAQKVVSWKPVLSSGFRRLRLSTRLNYTIIQVSICH